MILQSFVIRFCMSWLLFQSMTWGLWSYRIDRILAGQFEQNLWKIGLTTTEKCRTSVVQIWEFFRGWQPCLVHVVWRYEIFASKKVTNFGVKLHGIKILTVRLTAKLYFTFLCQVFNNFWLPVSRNLERVLFFERSHESPRCIVQ